MMMHIIRIGTVVVPLNKTDVSSPKTEETLMPERSHRTTNNDKTFIIFANDGSDALRIHKLDIQSRLTPKEIDKESSCIFNVISQSLCDTILGQVI